MDDPANNAIFHDLELGARIITRHRRI